MRALKPARWNAVPLVLVVVLLLGSVLIPALQTWRIMHLLRVTTDVIEPARVLVDRLALGLTIESVALDRYAASGEGVDRTRYMAAVEDNRRLAAIDDFTQMLDADASSRAARLRAGIVAWRRSGLAIVTQPLSAAQRESAVRAQRTLYETSMRDIASLATYLSSEGSARRDVIRRSERSSLIINAALVFVALAAVFTVTALRGRERLLTETLQRRVAQESALREAAELLAAAFTVEDVTSQIVHSALRTMGARGAFVEQVVKGSGDTDATLVVRASAGVGVPAPGCVLSYAGSCTQRVLEGGEPMLFRDLMGAA